MTLNPQDRGFLLGDGIFETILVANKTALWRTEHLARMEQAAAELGLAFDRTEIDAAINQKLPLAPHVLRISLTRGVTARGLASSNARSTLITSLDPFDTRLMFQATTLATSCIRRNQHAPSSRLKTLSYIDNIAAARETAPHDALMCNTSGNAASAAIANLFLVKGDQLITPSLDQAILPGIMRGVLLGRFRGTERPVAPAELHTADAVFLTNSLRFIRPVTALDGKPLGTGNLGPLIDTICDLARQQCKIDLRGLDA